MLYTNFSSSKALALLDVSHKKNISLVWTYVRVETGSMESKFECNVSIDFFDPILPLKCRKEP